ncbi:MAG: hypothetical protein KJ690_02420 [Alphaproteobacteria bacterium]|uniref:hypothetical protein n=1 Tax=Brevundimonas sp. TaxID=1871086 RepID=UPI0017BAB4A1|nr:hypothetical protein [Brevundimonas sp.]MBA3051187.1 hypothetical protein [Brevundimonas sp.]MBU4135254.1 hypothetical protein [Alphaproteobacteria bacterium]
MLSFFRHVLSYTVRFAVLLMVLLALAFAMEAMNSGAEAARSAEFVSRAWQAVLASLFAIVPAILLFAIQQTMKERRETP